MLLKRCSGYKTCCKRSAYWFDMMRAIFLHGFKTGLQQWRIVFVVYLIQLGLALTLGLQVHEVLKASIGQSLALNQLLAGYDHTVITDFLKVHGASITPLIGQLRWLILLWLLFSIFINGGLLYCANAPEQASVRAFWRTGAMYFFPFLKISLLMLMLALVWTVLLWLPTLLYLEPALEYFPSEQYIVWLAELIVVVWLLGLAVVFAWSVLSRMQYLYAGASTLSCLKAGWQAFRINKVPYFALLSGFGCLLILLVLAYYFLQAHAGMTSPFLLLLFFIAQQLVVFSRILVRQMLYVAISAKAAKKL